MTVNRRLLDAMHTHDVNYKEYLEKAKILDGSAGAERVKLQNELAEWVEETFPLRTYKYPLGREATETEMHMMNVVFNDSTYGSVLQARGIFEILSNQTVASLSWIDLDIKRHEAEFGKTS